MSQRKLHGKYCAVGDSGIALPEAASFQMKFHFYKTIVFTKDTERNCYIQSSLLGKSCVQSFILL
ncbi:MAG TPA: hypothetical protein PLE74_05220 [Candidatus Cloacimonadota bacterium]|nr:hypothetical protein [Candidatus Cloacimonadota bacterium]HPT71662.1 hypothetical protein [Candidatus Cloacimonadota bacterium]